MSDIYYSYLAGIIDGEGCLCVGQYSKTKKGTPTWVVTLQVSNTEEKLIDWLCENFDGKKSIYTFSQLPKNSKKTVFRWSVYGKDLQKICTNVLPYSVIKKRQIEIVLEMFDSFSKRFYCVGQRGPSISQFEIDRRYRLLKEIRTLHNRRGSLKHL